MRYVFCAVLKCSPKTDDFFRNEPKTDSTQSSSEPSLTLPLSRQPLTKAKAETVKSRTESVTPEPSPSSMWRPHHLQVFTRIKSLVTEFLKNENEIHEVLSNNEVVGALGNIQSIRLQGSPSLQKGNVSPLKTTHPTFPFRWQPIVKQGLRLWGLLRLPIKKGPSVDGSSKWKPPHCTFHSGHLRFTSVRPSPLHCTAHTSTSRNLEPFIRNKFSKVEEDHHYPTICSTG